MKKTFILILLLLSMTLCVSCSKKDGGNKKNADFDKLVEKAFEEYADDNDYEFYGSEKGDFDNDGNIEHIGLFIGDSDDDLDYIAAILCARELKKDIETFDYKMEGTYPYIWQGTLELEGSQKKYLKMAFVGEYNYAGAEVYEVKEDKIEKVLKTDDPEKSYFDIFVDENDNGAYDYGVNSINLRDYQKHIIEYWYKWTGSEFSKLNSKMKCHFVK